MAGAIGVSVLVRGLHHPEGVAVLPGRGLVCGSDHGVLTVADPDRGTSRVLASVPGATFLGICVDGDGGVVACDLAGRRVVRCHDGRVDVLPEPPGGWVHPNAAAFTAEGRLFVSDSGRWGRCTGRLVEVDIHGASVVPINFGDSRPGLDFANGVCLDRDGHLWVVESAAPGITCLDVDGHSARVVRRVALPGTVPDGLAALADGSLLVACYRPDRVLHVGRTVRVIADDPTGLRLAGPTNVALFGPHLDRAAVACFGGYHLAALDAPVPGLAVHRPVWTGWAG